MCQSHLVYDASLQSQEAVVLRSHADVRLHAEHVAERIQEPPSIAFVTVVELDQLIAGMEYVIVSIVLLVAAHC